MRTLQIVSTVLVACWYKGWLDLPCYCLCFEPVKARHQKPALMVRSHAGLPGWLAPTRLKGFD